MSRVLVRLPRSGRRSATVVVGLVVGVIGLVITPLVVDARVSPRTTVDRPAAGATVSGDLVVTGSARHPVGIERVEVVVKDLDRGRYWNGERWQRDFVRFPVPVDPPGGTEVRWSASVPADQLARGAYRARAFARSVEGNGDAHGGDAAEFDHRPGLDPRRYDTEIDAPADRAVVSGSIEVEGRATSSDGVAAVLVVIRQLDSGRYWDGDAGGWSDRFVRTPAVLSDPGATTVRWSVEVPADETTVGEYRARAWVRTVPGRGDPFGRGRSAFSVTAESPVPAATAPPTTLPPTTLPPTTATTSTTRPPTTPPPPTATTSTTAPPEATTSTTAPPPEVAPSSEVTAPPPETTAPGSGCAGGDPAILLPCAGVLIGASGDFRDRSGALQSKSEDFGRTEAALGADFDLFHDFLQWDDLVSRRWPSPGVQALADDGRFLLTNWKSPTGHPRDWARIAAGDLDADIVAAARQVAAFGQPTFLTFFHEPEDNIRAAAGGDPDAIARYLADYRAAFRHLHRTFDANGADNAIWVWDMQGWLGGFESYYNGGLYPGDDVVDWVAWNPYNWHACENHGSRAKWTTFTEVVAPFYDWLDEGGPGRPSLDKPLMLGEFGTEENRGAPNADQTKAEWLAEAAEVLPTRFPRLRAVVYFDTEGRRADGSVQFCEWAIDSSPEAAAAMAEVLADPELTVRW
ncbi:MAG: hypothetical protein AAF547_15565 [Actinomycetota bacterium]